MDNLTWHALDIPEVLQILKVNPATGLSPDEASNRLGLHGPNQLAEDEQQSAWIIFFSQFKNLLLIILLVAVVLSGLIGELTDAAIIAVIVLFCALLGFVQEYRAERALEALKSLLAATCTVVRGGERITVLARDVVPGDILALDAGDRIPADGRVIEVHSLRCDEAPLTGESAPVGKTAATLPSFLQLPDRKNMVFAGSSTTYGRARAVVTSTGLGTAIGKISKEVAEAPSVPSPLEKRTHEIGKWLGVTALVICFAVAAVSVLRQYATGNIDLRFCVAMLMFAISLAVAAVPEALPAIVTGSLAIGMRHMAKRNVLIRKMSAVETLGCTSVICTDKTGTLTKGEMTVRKLYLWNTSIEVSGAGYDPAGDFGAFDTSNPDLRQLLLAGLLCNDADVVEANGTWTAKGDPTEAALVALARKAGLDVGQTRRDFPRVEEFPFSSERKRMSTIHDAGPGARQAFLKGAVEITLERCASVLDQGLVRGLVEQDRREIMRVAESMALRGLRVLGLAYTDIATGEAEYEVEAVERNMVFLGLAGMMDPPRPEVAEAVAACRKVGIKPVMITGDHKITAVAVAREIGIYHEGDSVLLGQDLEDLSDAQLEQRVERTTVYARVSPADKLKIVKAWKKRGHVVAMTGDGVNDAPALKHADIGIAMGITGSAVAKEAADIVLADDNFASIVAAVERGRWIYDNIKKYLAYLLRCNITEVAVIGGVALFMGPDFLPLLPAAILYVNLATDGLPALALGFAPPDADIMLRPPRDPKESIFSWDVKFFTLLGLALETPLFFAVFLHDFKNLEHARTEMFLLFIVVELAIVLNFRSLRASVFQAKPHKWLWIAIAWELALAAFLLLFEPVRATFGIGVPLLTDLAVVGGVAAVVVFSMELAKIAVRRRERLAGRAS